MLGYLRFCYTAFRHFLWQRLGFKYPALPGWQKLVREVAAVEVWVEPSPPPNIPPLLGAPLQWSLLRREDGTNRVVATSANCAWSGVPISGSTPQVTLPDGTVRNDVSSYGVRCARCGVPIHVRHAGMKSAVDVPSCPPDRKAVREVIETA